MISYEDKLKIIANCEDICQKFTNLLEKCKIMKGRVGYPTRFRLNLATIIEKLNGMRSIFNVINDT